MGDDHDAPGGAMRWPLAVSTWTLREPSIDKALDRIAAAGYHAVELGGPPTASAPVLRALAASGLTAISACPTYGPAHDFGSDDRAVRAAAADLLRRWMDLAGEAGAKVVIVVPSDRPDASQGPEREELLSRCADSIGSAVAGCDPKGPVAVIEPINRGETHLVRTMGDAERVRSLIDSPHVELMADVFHMNLEEDSVTRPLRTHATHLRHVHLADEDRREPGRGGLDLGGVLRTLADIGYGSGLAFEFVPVTDGALRRARCHIERLQAEATAEP